MSATAIATSSGQGDANQTFLEGLEGLSPIGAGRVSARTVSTSAGTRRFGATRSLYLAFPPFFAKVIHIVILMES